MIELQDMCKFIIYTVPLMQLGEYLKLGNMIYYSMKNRLIHLSYDFFKRKKKLTVKDKSRYSNLETKERKKDL